MKSKKRQCSRGDSFSHGSNRGQKVQSCSLSPIAQSQTDGRKPSKGFGPRGESPSGRKDRKPCSKSSNQSVRTRRVVIGTFPYVKITSLRLDAYVAVAVSDTLRRRKSPARSQRKVVRKDQLL